MDLLVLSVDKNKKRKEETKMVITISHRGIIIAECKSNLEAFEQMKKWRSILEPLEVKVMK